MLFQPFFVSLKILFSSLFQLVMESPAAKRLRQDKSRDAVEPLDLGKFCDY